MTCAVSRASVAALWNWPPLWEGDTQALAGCVQGLRAVVREATWFAMDDGVPVHDALSLPDFRGTEGEGASGVSQHGIVKVSVIHDGFAASNMCQDVGPDLEIGGTIVQIGIRDPVQSCCFWCHRNGRSDTPGVGDEILTHLL